ncbi:MAG: hypothetical protein BWX80_03939 [Candidatus Hydrogenedentes bacterium ADurb.Bin101]|nr:MAG: hypothetical protein BWX80_03939 [Candidatus Hydrogenedentes bacterium ADurb.Bin101]
MDTSKLDMEEITAALEDHSGMAIYYLDREIGNVMPLAEYDHIDGDEALREQIDENPSRYIMIDPIPSRDSFRFMEEFVESLPDGEDKRILERALEWRKPFSNFKNALYDMPEIRERWFVFKNECMRRYILEWIKDIGEE